MTEGDAAIKLALELLHMPSRVRYARTQPLPAGLLQLLQVAAGDDAAADASARSLERSKPLVREASQFFIEQILLAPDADSYRVLGSPSSATTAELRRNMALLLRSLHPDVEHAERSIFAQRITGAWDQLKTPERRASYDREHRRADQCPPRKLRRMRLKRRPHRTPLRQALAVVLGLVKP